MDDLALGERVRRARERARLTQLELAERLGVSRRTVANWETGQTVPMNRLGAIEEVLGNWGFAGSTEVPANPLRRTNADGVIAMIGDVLRSRFSPSVQVEMIRDLIHREYEGPAEIGTDRAG